MTFGDYLRSLRDAKTWTQPDAANQIGIEQSYLSKLETGKSLPSSEVFEKLVKAYTIDVDHMTASITSSDLRKLTDIRAVRSSLLNHQAQSRRDIRNWLIASAACWVLGGASLGLSLLGKDMREERYHFRSYGVLNPEEPLSAFNVLTKTKSFAGSNVEQRRAAFEAEQSAMAQRVDEVFVSRLGGPSENYVLDTESGRRYFELVDSERVTLRSPLRWFLAPALAFLLGGLACFAASFRQP